MAFENFGVQQEISLVVQCVIYDIFIIYPVFIGNSQWKLLRYCSDDDDDNDGDGNVGRSMIEKFY